MKAQDFRTLVVQVYGEDKLLPAGEATAQTRTSDQAWIDEFKDEIAAYLKDAVCVNANCVCGRNLLGLLGTFQWGIQHGVGTCSECGVQYRLYHYFGDKHNLIFPEIVGIPKSAVPA